MDEAHRCGGQRTRKDIARIRESESGAKEEVLRRIQPGAPGTHGSKVLSVGTSSRPACRREDRVGVTVPTGSAVENDKRQQSDGSEIVSLTPARVLIPYPACTCSSSAPSRLLPLLMRLTHCMPRIWRLAP